MTFRDEVQKSAEVKFAMAVFHALNSNNFVRFFRLLRYIFKQNFFSVYHCSGTVQLF